MDDSEFHRLKRLPPYVFAEVNAMKARARAAGQDVIDLGMGNPDLPTASHIVAKLAEAAANPRAHGYSASRGIPGLRKAQAAYYARRFGVELDPESEIIVTLGSKEGLANLAQAITSPGDIVLVPNPSYPIHPYGFIIAGGSVRHIPVPGSTSLEEFLPALERAVRHTVPKPIALVLNYPSNPTAQVVDLDFYAAIVDFCKRQGIWILSDLAYAEIYFDDVPPPSVLQVPGARDIAVEFTSMSKTYSMAGWRMGFAAGNKTLIQALTRIKSYLDYGAFTPIQVAATAALNGPQDCIAEARNTYKERRDVLIEGLSAAGWNLPAPSASMFAWAPLPKEFAELGSLAFSKLLLTQANVAVSPGIGFGEHGDAHVRIALVENKHRIRQAIRNIRQVMADPGRAIDLYLRGVGDNITPLKARA
jgi:alanine-synthesizing transaminase